MTGATMDKGVAIEVLGTCETNTTVNSQHDARVDYHHLWSYAQQAALIAVSDMNPRDGCYRLICDPERRAKRIAGHYAQLYFNSAKKSDGRIQFRWPAPCRVCRQRHRRGLPVCTRRRAAAGVEGRRQRSPKFEHGGPGQHYAHRQFTVPACRPHVQRPCEGQPLALHGHLPVALVLSGIWHQSRRHAEPHQAGRVPSTSQLEHVSARSKESRRGTSIWPELDGAFICTLEKRSCLQESI
jgi:hypothetical protein